MIHTRKDKISEVKEFLIIHSKNKPTKDSEEDTFGYFSDYYDTAGSVFESYTLEKTYHILICGELIDDTEIFNLVITSYNEEDIIAELDYDNLNQVHSFLRSCNIIL